MKLVHNNSSIIIKKIASFTCTADHISRVCSFPYTQLKVISSYYNKDTGIIVEVFYSPRLFVQIAANSTIIVSINIV
ncbi:hypothetical protein BKM30_13100 [Pseudomonas syringae pv. syringae]|nr:hypothetical protein BKM27_13715 [Pseudomonas syringae pv. syringae]POR78430.1 hypothetical protein BKM30_13100 [Pseudomonas syringae pv. syringae]